MTNRAEAELNNLREYLESRHPEIVGGRYLTSEQVVAVALSLMGD